MHAKSAVQARTGQTVLREAVTGQNIEELVAAHSRVLDKLSRELADNIRLLDHKGK